MNSKSCTKETGVDRVCEDGCRGHVVQSAAAMYALPQSIAEFFFRRMRKCGQLKKNTFQRLNFLIDRKFG